MNMAPADMVATELRSTDEQLFVEPVTLFPMRLFFVRLSIVTGNVDHPY